MSQKWGSLAKRNKTVMVLQVEAEVEVAKVLNIGYRDHIVWGFFISDIEDTRAYWAFISDIIYNEILISKSRFSVIDVIYLIKWI